MPTSLAPPEVRPNVTARRRAGFGDLNGGFGGGDSNWGGGSGDGAAGTPPDAYRMAIWLGLASIVMLFAGLSSAYVFRMGTSLDWRTIEIPSFLLPNSCLLLASSASLEVFRRRLRQGLSPNVRLLLAVTVLLGAGFLFGQVWIWRTLSSQGIYLSTNPHSSFFYLMTGVHAIHLVGGILALGFLLVKIWLATQTRPGLQTFADITAIYWHFMDGLWIYLFLLLFFWR